LENLFLAWREFKRGKIKKPGVREFNFNLENNLFALRDELRNKIYRPDKYAFFYVCDPKLRPIHKATIKDRVVFQAVFRILYQIFDRKLIYDTYSCRFLKGTHRGVWRLEDFLRKTSGNYRRHVFALKCDIRQFFYSIDHGILKKLIEKEIDDEGTMDLIFKIIDSFCAKPGKGLPLGNVTSQLFANIYLNGLDRYVKHILKEKYYLRYCDDFIVLGLDEAHLASMMLEINDFLYNHLQLVLHPGKVKIRKLLQGIDFLGYVSLPYRRVIRTRTKRRIFSKIDKKMEECRNGLLVKRSLNKSVQSYLGVLKHCRGYNLEKKIIEMTP
jgi:retron-type reverse transcriptase